MKISDILSEVTLGNYRKKAQLSQAGAGMNKFFNRDDPAKVAAADQTIAKREKGLGRADARYDKLRASQEEKAKFDREQAIRDKYTGVDIDAEIAKLQPALKSAYNDYQYGARNTWSQGKAEYDRISAQIRGLENAKKVLGGEDPAESATGGGMSTGGNATANGKGRPDSIVV
jgi:hypothetical protein